MISLLNQLKSNKISQRQFISKIKGSKEYIKEVEDQTGFLNEYNPDILERIYYIINDLHDIVKCSYCGKKAKWTGRINEGYKTTCCSKECESKRISEQKSNKTIISDNRNNKFVELQSTITDNIDDNVIKSIIQYDSQIDLLTNKNIISYLENRYKDSVSLIETYRRIKLGVEEKPKCPVCGKPVTFVGKQSKMFTKYCSNECAGRSKETIQKKKQTQLEHWGTENCYNSEKYKALYKEKYGVEYSSQREDSIKNRKNTLIEKYGTTKLFTVPEIKEKIIKTNIEKFGYDCVFKSPEVKQKAYEQLKLNGVLGTSKEEDKIYNYFLALGYKPQRFYRCEKFPYNVDFYLEEYDLFIEYQGSQYHHKRAYTGSKDDLKEIDLLLEKDAERRQITGKDTQYSSIINVWTNLDVSKRNYATNNHINYLEIYNCTSKESLKRQLDLYLGCLNNTHIFSTDKLDYEFNKCNNIEYTGDLLNSYLGVSIIRYFQENKFYKKEKEIYAKQPLIRRKLIQNRMKYLNKKEEDITVTDIINGFKISGINYGYSHFNPQWTNWFVNKFNIKTVYDPCGGWGHHMLGMLNCDKIIYNDIDNEIYSGVSEMKKYFDIYNLECHNNDGRMYNPEDVDGFFMCPPYFNVEVYSENNVFNNIGEYKDFLNDIFDIWKKNKANIFGLIIREDFVDLINCKYNERYDLPVNKTHFVKKDSKRYKEYFYIFKK